VRGDTNRGAETEKLGEHEEVYRHPGILWGSRVAS